jgi:hypothetical protein
VNDFDPIWRAGFWCPFIRAHRLELPNPGLKPWAELFCPFGAETLYPSLMLTRTGVARLERVPWTGGAGTRIRSEALHRTLTIGRLAADHAERVPIIRLTSILDGS